MIAPCISWTAMPRLSNTAFSDLNWGRNRMRSNRCCSVSFAAGGFAPGGLASDILIIKLFSRNDVSIRLARREQSIVVDRGRNVHDSFARRGCPFRQSVVVAIQPLKIVTGSFIQGSPGQIISAILTRDETRLGPGQSRAAGAHAGRVPALFCARPPQPAREGDSGCGRGRQFLLRRGSCRGSERDGVRRDLRTAGGRDSAALRTGLGPGDRRHRRPEDVSLGLLPIAGEPAALPGAGLPRVPRRLSRATAGALCARPPAEAAVSRRAV